MRISFNLPSVIGKEYEYIKEAVSNKHLSGNGFFTKKCQEFIERKYEIKQTFLTSSCTDALEMAAILANVSIGDEVIVPAYTFVSSANAFVLRGAKIVLADSSTDHPNIDPDKISDYISHNSKVLIVVHYGGVACDMDKIMSVAEEHDLIVIEDAAQCINSFYNQKALGSIGQLGSFSFHETKNIQCGEGGMLNINDEKLRERANNVWQKGTNRQAFSNGKVDKYEWVDIGSSFMPSELTAAYLFAQLENIEKIQKTRLKLWERYFKQLGHLAQKGFIELPKLPHYATNNAHIFCITVSSRPLRNDLLEYLSQHEVEALFHYTPLHQSKYYRQNFENVVLPNAERFGDRLIRLPLHIGMSIDDVDYVCDKLQSFHWS